MPVYHGINPHESTRQAAETFENEIMIRFDNRFLVSTVYLDMDVIRWAVAIAYNPSRGAGLSGLENILEVRYTYFLNKRMTMKMLRSEPMEEAVIPAGPFQDPDAFVCHALMHERNLVKKQK